MSTEEKTNGSKLRLAASQSFSAKEVMALEQVLTSIQSSGGKLIDLRVAARHPTFISLIRKIQSMRRRIDTMKFENLQKNETDTKPSIEASIEAGDVHGYSLEENIFLESVKSGSSEGI